MPDLRPDHLPAPSPVRNEVLFEKIAAQIEETPQRWAQDSWVSYLKPETGEAESVIYEAQRGEWCDTAFCIAGWAMQLSNTFEYDEKSEFNSDGDAVRIIDFTGADPFDKGLELLGLTYVEADHLFHKGMDVNNSPAVVAEVADYLRAIGRGEDVFEAAPSWW